MRLYFEEIRGSVLPTVPELYLQFQHKLPHSDDLMKDQDSYIDIGRQFLLTITCDALYYGRFMNQFVDSIVDEGFKVSKKKRTPQPNARRKIALIDDVVHETGFKANKPKPAPHQPRKKTKTNDYNCINLEDCAVNKQPVIDKLDWLNTLPSLSS